MPTIKTDLEMRLFSALKRIACYQSPDYMERHAERDWGCSADEAIPMAYENVLEEANRAIKGIRQPRK